MNVLNYLRRPEYVFRPRQVLRRLRRCCKRSADVEMVRLPWGAPVMVRPQENIGSSIYYYGIFDLVVPESIFRLLDPGEAAVDVGANIGQNTSLMASCAGRSGVVIAFEPHPEIFQELTSHVRLWQSLELARIQLENVALGSAEGEAALIDGADFATNRGSACLAQGVARDRLANHVHVRTMDSYLDGVSAVGLCKIDVEGHELNVLQGAHRTLARRGIRDIIYEDFSGQPSPVADLLRGAGYALFGLSRSWLGPVLRPLDSAALQPGFSHNYVATLDVPRLKARFAPRGWRCLYKNP
jgi:FkbM family methyltransferase